MADVRRSIAVVLVCARAARRAVARYFHTDLAVLLCLGAVKASVNISQEMRARARVFTIHLPATLLDSFGPHLR